MATTRYESDDDSEDNVVVLPSIYSKKTTMNANLQSPKKSPLPSKKATDTNTVSKALSKPLPKLGNSPASSAPNSPTSTGGNTFKVVIAKSVILIS